MKPENRETILSYGFKIIEESAGYEGPVSYLCRAGHPNKTRIRTLLAAVRDGESCCAVCYAVKRAGAAAARYEVALRHLDLEHISGEPKNKQSSLRVRCRNCDTTRDTTLEQISRSYTKGTAGCGKCRDNKHRDEAGGRFFKELRERGLEPMGEYTDARTKVKVRRESDGAVNHISTMDWAAKREWPGEKSVLLTHSDLQHWLDANKPGYQLLDATQYRGQYSKVSVRCAGLGGEKHAYSVNWGTLKYFNCAKCQLWGTSKEEMSFAARMEELGYPILKHFVDYPLGRTEHFNQKEFDLFLPEQKLCVEYCGIYHHALQPPGYHQDKLELAWLNGYRLLTIFSDEWDSQEVCLHRIKRELTPPARMKLEMRELPLHEALLFMSGNSVEILSSKLAIGFYSGEELLVVMGVEQTSVGIIVSQISTKMGFYPEIRELLAALPKPVFLQLDLRWDSPETYAPFQLVGKMPPHEYFVRGNKRAKVTAKDRDVFINAMREATGETPLSLFDCGSSLIELS